MPYVSKGKCVYKRDTGKKVGCTKGSVKKYLSALHANVNESTTQNYDFLKDAFNRGESLKGLKFKINGNKDNDISGVFTITGSVIDSLTDEGLVLSIKSSYEEPDRILGVRKSVYNTTKSIDELVNGLNSGLYDIIELPSINMDTLNESSGGSTPVQYPGIVMKPKVGDRVVVNGIYGFPEDGEEFKFNNEIGTVVEVDVAQGLSFRAGGEVIISFDYWRLPEEIRDGWDGSIFEDCHGGKCVEFSNLMDTDFNFSVKPLSKEMDVKGFDAFENLYESEEHDLGWAEDAVSVAPLDFNGKEILIDIRELNSDEREELVDILEDYMQPDDDEMVGWPNDCFRMGEYRKTRTNSISLHCGVEDHDYIPKKGLICCLHHTYEEDSNKGNITPMDGKVLLNYFKSKNINESEDDLEWAEDVSNAKLTFNNLVFKPHRLPGGVRARLNFPNGHYISVVGGPHLYGDGVDTFEIWRSDEEDPKGPLTKGEVTQEMLELQELPPLEGEGTFGKEPITEEIESDLEWANDALSDEVWMRWEDVNVGDYIEVKEGDDYYRHVDGNMWNVIGFRNCEVYNPNDWSVVYVPCMRLQSVFDKNGVRWLSGQNVDIKKRDDLKFKIVDTSEMYKERGWKPMTESDDLEWAQDAVNGLDEYHEYNGEDLSPNTILMISGEYEDLYFEDQWARIVRREGDKTYLLAFPHYIENDDAHTHCGEPDRYESDEYNCGCSDSDSQVGNCWFINLEELNEVKVFPSLRGFLNENKSLLTEGRYDAITRKVVKDVMQVVTSTQGNLDEVTQAELPNSIRSEEYEYMQEGLGFSVELNVHHQPIFHSRNAIKESEAYFVDAAIAEGDDNVMMLTVVVDPTWEPNVYETLFYKLQEVVRHEIEHLTQSGYYRIEDRPKSTTSTAKLKTVYGHHKHKIEVPALVHGFYRRAKLEKRPIDDVMIEDLDSEIEKGNLTKKQAENLLKTWVEYAKKNLPTAIYSQE